MSGPRIDNETSPVAIAAVGGKVACNWTFSSGLYLSRAGCNCRRVVVVVVVFVVSFKVRIDGGTVSWRVQGSHHRHKYICADKIDHCQLRRSMILTTLLVVNLNFTSLLRVAFFYQKLTPGGCLHLDRDCVVDALVYSLVYFKQQARVVGELVLDQQRFSGRETRAYWDE